MKNDPIFLIRKIKQTQNSIHFIDKVLSLTHTHAVPVKKIEEREERKNLHGRIRNVFILMAFPEEEKVGKTRNLDARVKVALIDSGRKAAADPGICQRRQETWPT